MAETNATPIQLRTLKRAFIYEEQAANSPCSILRTCMKEYQQTNSTRERAINKLGFSRQWISDAKEMNADITNIMHTRALYQYKQRESVSLKQQKVVRPGHLAEYLGRGRAIKLVARFRLQNEERAKQDWRSDKMCRVCGAKPELIAHILECSGSACDERMLLDERGEGAHEMERIKNWQLSNRIK